MPLVFQNSETNFDLSWLKNVIFRNRHLNQDIGRSREWMRKKILSQVYWWDANYFQRLHKHLRAVQELQPLLIFEVSKFSIKQERKVLTNGRDKWSGPFLTHVICSMADTEKFLLTRCYVASNKLFFYKFNIYLNICFYFNKMKRDLKMGVHFLKCRETAFVPVQVKLQLRLPWTADETLRCLLGLANFSFPNDFKMFRCCIKYSRWVNYNYRTCWIWIHIIHSLDKCWMILYWTCIHSIQSYRL